jgi:hypothetical protein
MPRYEPKRNAEPLVRPGDTVKMRITGDGTFKPVVPAPEPVDEQRDEAPADPPQAPPAD